MLETKEIIRQLKIKLQEVHTKPYSGKEIWTKAFKDCLRNYGTELKLKSYPNEKYGQWLFDFCWSKEEIDWKFQFEGLALACEIEWSKNINDIIYDFQKLTVIDADIRLFIFQYDNDIELTYMKEAINKASRFTIKKGYSYIIAASGNNDTDLDIYELNINTNLL